ncbi:MAG: NADPH-dependent assimilatory sulfite reductase hemoprotein subunit [Phycisphaerae bacterium]|jgi:sulfite reductase (ferredoxin)|nr:NADPH-dependent assimilatory sulfite reductase hemoprotein subunit [Phycisphaerae bacterium]
MTDHTPPNSSGQGSAVPPQVAQQPATELSRVEVAKLESRALRGHIAETLADGAAPCFTEDDKHLLKFHGIYQQDNRDTRHGGAGKSYSMMVRLRIPGGALTGRQWLELDALSDTVGNGTLRLTTRQSIQYHGIAKGDLKTLMQGINRAFLSTLSACGDVQRNVMAPPAPFADEAHRTVQRVAHEVAIELSPATGAYAEIWLDGERVASNGDEEPFYGDRYLPRKFKTGIALDTDNSIDIFTYDCGLVGITRGGTIVGYNLLVGGGLGMTHNKSDTFARIATPIGYLPPERAIDAVRTVGAIYRDLGNRVDRRHARLKYLLESWGVERFVQEFRSRVDWELAPPVRTERPRELDHIGHHEQGDGRDFYGVFVENGRVADGDTVRYRSAFRRIIDELNPNVRLTPMQSILFTDLQPESVARLVAILREHGVRTVEELSPARRWSMACPALPTCGLALTDSERIMPSTIDLLERELERIGVGGVPLTVRMTGCPNGCARPYNADIALVGRKPGVYHVYVGGGLAGDRLADLFAADVPIEQFVVVLRPLLERFSRERRDDESLGDFYQRILPPRDPRTILTGKEAPTSSLVALTVRGVAESGS